MERCVWLLKKGLLFPAKRAMLSIASRLQRRRVVRDQTWRKHGLMKLYNDIESCRGYADIQVMWEMIHSSSCPAQASH
ncbi:hypothetical protein QJS04_geneDACA005999 [Acorus gramineus]|uniref:Uncharacterized protein n=1 Tax=Acorus gramineus TaxID=55184 RepID=A0AAV9B621_ACOGR|nr:hypothetical protein QJS04_geneDACA005999 [Acorus gramineus]